VCLTIKLFKRKISQGRGGNFGSAGGGTHAASSATTVLFNTNTACTRGGRIDITYTVLSPVTWLDFTAAGEKNGSDC
jgi:hypothetical protein